MNWLVVSTGCDDADRRYLAWVQSQGIGSVVLRAGDPLPQAPGAFAALLLTGGGDVAPERYGAEPEPETGGMDQARDEREAALVHAFLAAGRPVFGICRGLQSLTVALGGRLIQHIPRWLAARAPGAAPEEHGAAGGADAVHPVRWVPDSRLAAALRGAATVNSAHHQAADPARLGGRLRAAAWSGLGVVEAVEGIATAAPVVAVQWHPERLAPADHPASAGLLRWWAELGRRP